MRSTPLLAISFLGALACATPPPGDAPELASIAPYAFVTEGSTVVAENPAQALALRFEHGVVRVAPLSEPTTELSLETVGLGCEGDVRAVGVAEPRTGFERVELAREGGMVEWYANAAAGLEQGFTLSEQPACASSSSVVIEMRASGLTGVLEGNDVSFRDALGAPVLGYASLHVEDADGTSVPAHLAVLGDRVRIVIDDHGARYPLAVDPLITNEQTRLLASDGAASDRFGHAIAVSGDTMVIGAPEVGASDSGAAYVFVRSGTGTWSQQARLAVAGTSAFGLSVAIDGDTIVVGAPYTSSFVGTAYVFARAGATWSLQATLASPGIARAFGTGVAISGNIAVVGAEGSMADFGAAHVFTRAGTAWSLTQTISATSAFFGAGSKFGAAVAFDGTTIAVGAPVARGPSGTAQGLAYTFRLSCFGSWSQEAEVSDTAGSIRSEFGAAIAVSGDTLLVGANNHPFFDSRGAAYVFTRTPTGSPPCPSADWTLQQQLTPSDAADGDHFGQSVALSGDRALVGASGTMLGAGYYFTRTGTVWSERTKLVASSGTLLAMGVSAALGTTFSALGAPVAPSATVTNPGAVYVFDTSRAPNGGTCVLGSDCASNFCVDGFCCNSACGGGSATDCQSCSVATGATVDGTCSARVTGTCDDASLCTTGDSCGAGGVCVGAAVSCAPLDPCHTASCAPATGLCVDAARPDGATCSDGNGCTSGDTCQAAVCTGGGPTVCAALDACHIAGTCDPATGACTNPVRADGSACDDGNACTQTDVCAAGSCAGASPVVCAALDQCHAAGICSPATGTCSSPSRPDGTACDDGVACTTDTCQSGACAGAPVVCAPIVCHEPRSCVAGTGACSAMVPSPDGTACPGGVCTAGVCIGIDSGVLPDAAMSEDAGTDGGGDTDVDAASTPDSGMSTTDGAIRDAGRSDGGRDGGPADGSADAAFDAGGVPGGTAGGCGCTVPSRSGGSPLPFALGLLGLAIATRRRLARRR